MLSDDDLGFRFIDFQSQNMTVAACETVERKTLGHLSYRVPARSAARPLMMISCSFAPIWDIYATEEISSGRLTPVQELLDWMKRCEMAQILSRKS